MCPTSDTPSSESSRGASFEIPTGGAVGRNRVYVLNLGLLSRRMEFCLDGEITRGSAAEKLSVVIW